MCPLRAQHHSICHSAKQLIFACSGGSDVGHLADLAARELVDLGIGKMGCLAGLAAQNPGSVRDAKSADEIVVIDGCAGECARKTLEAAGIEGFEHVRLTDLNLEKDKSPATDQRVAMVVHHVTQRLRG
ncbi:MAG: hypothetical protein KJ000_08600 [Pirellulaceae bacterium]|nr:hypothetical protein [Pirellulaceae bacterium]